MLERLLQTLMDGLAVGSLYALIALGYTMVYGILKFINFAHSDVFVLGAWISFAAAIGGGWGPGGAPAPAPAWMWTSLFALTALAAVAAAVEYGLFRRSAAAKRRFNLAETRFAGALALAAGWAWLALGVFGGARQAKLAGLDLLSGLLILVCAMLACGLAGFTIERLAYKPLRAAPRLNVLITAIGVSLLLQNTGQLPWLFGTRPQPMPKLLPDQSWLLFGNLRLWLVDIMGAGTAVVLMVLLDRLVFHTRLGRAMRAVSFNANNAALMGIPVDRVISFTFVLGSMLAAAAGFLYSMKYSGLNQPAAATWVLLGLKAFVAAVIGGIGNIHGAMLGGILIGLLEFFGAAYLSADLRDVYVFSLLILVLLVRPSGLLGKATVEKV